MVIYAFYVGDTFQATSVRNTALALKEMECTVRTESRFQATVIMSVLPAIRKIDTRTAVQVAHPGRGGTSYRWVV